MDGLTLDRHKILPVLDWTELEKKEQMEHSQEGLFFRYLGSTYSLDDFMQSVDPDWDGYLSDTFFSGVFVKLDFEYGEITKIHAVRYYV